MRPVLGTDEPCAIGERRVGCTDAFGNFNAGQPFIVLREVTRADYAAWLEFCGQTKPSMPEHRLAAAWFYEVATD